MGWPKAWLPIGREVLLPRMVRILQEAVPVVVVVAAPSQDVPPLPIDVLVLRDAHVGLGPLAGLHAGLLHLKYEADRVFLSSCDMPFLQPAFVNAVLNAAPSDGIAVPRVGGRLHPLASAYSVHTEPILSERLANYQLRMMDLFTVLPTKVLEEAELPDLRSVRNINTPEEYAAALAELDESL